jgi:hypothetical protein
MSIRKQFSKEFISNLRGGDERLKDLYALLDKAEQEPVLINVFIETNAQNDDEQADLGGYGKSLIIRESAAYLKKDPKSRIDLAVRYTTKKDILWQVGEKLGFPKKMSDWVKKENMKDWSSEEQKKYEKLYHEIFVDINALNKNDYDPSYIAEKLFVKVAECKPGEQAWKNRIIFFDSFDFQYLGDDHSPLRMWLRDKLIPYLVKKLGVSVFISGRERLEHEQRKHKKKLPVQEFQLQRFNEEQCRQYIFDYSDRKIRHETKKAEGYKQKKQAGEFDQPEFIDQELDFIHNALKQWDDLTRNIKPGEWKDIVTLTGGKPIILDFFADLCFRECIFKPKRNNQPIKPVGDILKAAQKEGLGKTPEEKFKMYLINRIHNHSFNHRDIEKFGYDMADALVLLSIAKHGMEVTDFLMVRDRKLRHEDISPKEKERLEVFFNYTLNDEYLSFVKNVKDAAKNDKEQDRRLLHDEVILLFKRYNLDLFDPEHEKRNSHIKHITDLYRVQMNQLGRNHDRYPRLLLEYMEYRFDYHGLEEERATINFFLYEFSFYLNRYADLNSRFIQIARKYYRNKEKIYLEGKENESANTVHFSKHYNLLSKILLRENHYHLTTRSDGWAGRIFSDHTQLYNERLAAQPSKKQDNKTVLPIIDDVYNGQNLSLLELRDKIGLRARALSATGEAKIWLTRWEEAREDLALSKQLFYRTGESHGLAWVEHLLGFEAQREARFESAERHHRDALDTAFLFSQRLISEARKEKTEHPDNWHHRYRLRYLVELSNRANGNLALRLRYQGRLLDALKILNANRLLAEISGIREEVRNKTNALQFRTIVGRDSDFSDAIRKIHDMLPGLDDMLLKRRTSNTELVHLIKSIGLESRIYRKRAQSFLNLKPHNKDKVEQKKKNINIVCKNLAVALTTEPNPLWPQDNTNPLNTLLPLTNTDNPLSGKPLSREVADMYYQLGKLILGAHSYPELFNELEYYKTELQNYRRRKQEDQFFFEVAHIAFQNAYYAAQKSTFLYLQMEAAESLYRLSYLSGNHRSKRMEYRGMYLAAQEIMLSDVNTFGTYHDLLSKYYITEADLLFDDLLEKHHLIPSMFKQPLEMIAMALWHGYQHNQERYMLILNVFTNRMKNILTRLHTVGLEEEFSEFFLEDVLSNTSVYRADPNFHIYLSHFLRALKMEVNGVIDWNIYRKVKLGISGLMEYGKFVKAADVNASLIRLLNQTLKVEKSPEIIQKTKRQLALRYYQQVYSFIGANRWKRANDLFENAKQFFYGDDQYLFDANDNTHTFHWHTFNTVEAAIMGLAKGIATYRTNEYWNIETFILGEVVDFRKKPEHLNQLLQAEQYLVGVALRLSKAINTQENDEDEIHPEENKVITRLMSEAFFRLGELYILLEPSSNDEARNKIGDEVREKIVPLIEEMLSTREIAPGETRITFRKTHRDNRRYDDSLAILMLSCAYYAAIAVDDKHRAADSLQSIANARYMRGETRDRNTNAIENITQNLNRGVLRHTRMRDTLGKIQIIYPVTEAKHWLVEGDVYFSELFEYDSKTTLFQFRKDLFDENDLRKNSKIKGLLHEMMWRYLTALDLLTDEKNKYDSYHFQNMAYEINRRIMYIKIPQLVTYVLEDLRSVWNLFPNLRSKERILQSLEHDLRTHALALSIKEIFDEA